MQLSSPCGPVKVLFTCVNIPPVISGLTIIPSDIMATMDAKVVSNSWENVQDDGRQNGTLLNAAQCPIQNGQICVYVRTIFCRFRPHRDPTYHITYNRGIPNHHQQPQSPWPNRVCHQQLAVLAPQAIEPTTMISFLGCTADTYQDTTYWASCGVGSVYRWVGRDGRQPASTGRKQCQQRNFYYTTTAWSLETPSLPNNSSSILEYHFSTRPHQMYLNFKYTKRESLQYYYGAVSTSEVHHCKDVWLFLE